MSEEYNEEYDGKYILEVERLVKYFPIRGGILRRAIGYVHAVDDISFKLERGKTLGLVGESGCGKTTTGRTILRLIEPTYGRIVFKGWDITSVPQKKLKKIRPKMQIIFQDPYASLNPRMTIVDTLTEPLLVHKIVKNKREAKEIALDFLEHVGMGEQHLYRYPHEFSGGQRQRICIARALLLNPELLILDEPTVSLDVSVQAQILNILKDLQEKFKLSYIYISHDISVVHFMSDFIAVMYLGKIVETLPDRKLLKEAKHPYTQALISSVPIPNPDIKQEMKEIKGEVPSAVNPPPGCRFHPRCPYAMEICRKEEPELVEVEPNHYVACFLYHKVKKEPLKIDLSKV
ncbi:MAG: ABC transporter ATP-binding protein [Candidatus Asgardarchaeia archaeon]